MWNLNSTGAMGTDLYANSGCQNGSGNGCSWNSNGTTTLGAFDILGSTGLSDPALLANEVMIHAQGEEAAFIAKQIGVDPSSPLNYSSYVDPAGQSFNFSLNAGSTYLGQPFTLAESGTLNPSTQTWNLSASGLYGGSPWQVTSTLVPTASWTALSTAYVTESILGTNCTPGVNCNDVECITYLGDVEFVRFELCRYSAGYSGIYGPYVTVPYNPPLPDDKLGSPDGPPVWVENFPYWGYSAYVSNFNPRSGSGSFVTNIWFPLTACKDCDVFASDLSPRGNLYQASNGWMVSGSETQGGTSYTVATSFVPARSGSVSQIDVAVGYVSGENSFYVDIDADNNGVPGAVLASFTGLSSSTNFGSCCGLVTISGISGLNLTANTPYFLVLGPENFQGTTWGEWNLSSVYAMGPILYSTDGGITWNSRGQQLVGAFDILGTTTQ